MSEEIQKIQQVISRIENRDFTVYIFVPDIREPAASVYDLYLHAQVLQKHGLRVVMLSESEDFEIPSWIEASLTAGLEHRTTTEEKEKNRIQVKAEDCVVIPEVLTNVMELTKKLSAMRLVMVHGFDAAIGSLAGGVSWSLFNMRHVMSSSPALDARIQDTFGREGFHYSHYQTGVPAYFQAPPQQLKQAKISFVTRNANDITKVVKIFYQKYPALRWLTFENLSGIPRPAFAEQMRESFLTLWIDRYASFGTVPVEAALSGNLLLGLVPDIHPPYVGEELGFWVSNIYEMPDVIARLATMFLDGTLPADLLQQQADKAAKYALAQTEQTIFQAWQQQLNDRLGELKNTLKRKTDASTNS